MTDRQNEIINASITLIAEKGIQGLTIKNLAKAINVTEPALYRHFENKTAILVAILDSFKSLLPGGTGTFGMGKKSALEKIEFIFEKHIRAFTETPQIVSVIFSDEIFRNDELLSAKIAQIMTQSEEMFLTIIKSGQKSGEIRKDISASHLALILMGSFRTLVKRWEMSHYEFNLEKESKALLKSVEKLFK